MGFTRYIISFIIFTFFSFPLIANAQDSYKEDDFTVSIKAFTNYAIISFELKNNAVFYWRNPGELGLATSINIDRSTNLKNYQIHWPLPQITESNNIASYVYERNTDIVISLTPVDFNKPIQLEADLVFSICQNSCQKYNVSLNNQIETANNDITPGEVLELLDKTPKSKDSNQFRISAVDQKKIDEKNWLEIEITTEKNILNPQAFFDLPKYVRFEPSNYDVISEENKQFIRLPFSIPDETKHEITDSIYVAVANDAGLAVEFEGKVDNISETSSSFLWILICAFIGGLILNIMPCVLPILVLKVLQLIKISEEQQLLRKSFIAQAGGIITCFVCFALFTYCLQFFGNKVGFGMHFQQPSYLITMIIILGLISINLTMDTAFGFIIPDFINKWINQNNQNSTLLGFFISGIFITLLAIPCTAPYVTVAIGFALTTDLFKMILIFFVMGMGMAFPYILLATFPKAAGIIPKPGEWMNTFKKITGIIIFITCLWMIYIISSQLGSRAAITLFLLLLLMKFVIVEKQALNIPTKRFILVVLIGLFYVLPQNIYEQNVSHDEKIEQRWQEYHPEDILSLVNENYIVVLDVSASWCTTCNLNKFTTLNNSSVLSTMNKYKLIAMRADISKATPEKVSNLMRQKHHHGIPLTIIYSKKHPDGLVLPTILTPQIFIAAIKNEAN